MLKSKGMDISDLKLYNQKMTIQNVNSLIFKRIAGTNGEIKALNYIQKELNKKNIENNTESFKWAKTIKNLARTTTIFIVFTSILYEVLILSNIFWIIIFLDFIFILIIYILFISLSSVTPLILVGKKKSSKNIIAKIKAVEKKPKQPLIIFSAHYDSVSSRYPYNSKKYFNLVVSIICFPYIFTTLIFAEWRLLVYFFDIFNNDLYAYLLDKSIDFSYVSFIFLMISFMIILTNRERSESLGSIDNASGVSILIELAKILNKNPLKQIDVIFLWCGAEEWGLWGSKQFCAKHFNELNEEYDLDKSYNINIDMVGTYIGLVDKTGIIKKKKGNEKLINILETSAKTLKIPLNIYNLAIEPRSDHISFRSFAKKSKKKMEACCFISNKDTKYIHTSRDTPNKCSSKNLNGCLNIIHNAIKTIDLQLTEE